MIQEIYPELLCDSAEYRRKYGLVSDLRRLGRRLNCLITTFGHGILGLLPSAACYSTAGLNLCVTDNMYVVLVHFVNYDTSTMTLIELSYC